MTTDQNREYARQMDQADTLARFRSEFWIPKHSNGENQFYFCGNSLGLQPKRLGREMAIELEAWKDLGVAGHFRGRNPWMRYHEMLRAPLANLVGALPNEVVAMNSLTVNLHLMMVSFYRPEGSRNRILIEKQAFPSDRYAVESQIRFHGLDPDQCLVELAGDQQTGCLAEDEIINYLGEYGDQVALVMFPGVQYATGQVFDMERIAEAARSCGAAVGFDLAHAIGNVSLKLHDWGCDFAVWCSYKYLNSGPGAVAGCFIHEQHSHRSDLPRFQGWWGHDPDSRFLMPTDFNPASGVDAWQLSNPPIYAMAPLRVSLELFEEAGFAALREKSIALDYFLQKLLDEQVANAIQVITPRGIAMRGCQLSLRVMAGREAGRELFEALAVRGYICDWREPDIIRVAPVPLYNTFEEIWFLVDFLRQETR